MIDHDAEMMLSYRNGGWSIRKIALHYGLSQKTVRERLTLGRRYEDLRIAFAIRDNPDQDDDALSLAMRVPPARVSQMRLILKRLKI